MQETTRSKALPAPAPPPHPGVLLSKLSFIVTGTFSSTSERERQTTPPSLLTATAQSYITPSVPMFFLQQAHRVDFDFPTSPCQMFGSSCCPSCPRRLWRWVRGELLPKRGLLRTPTRAIDRHRERSLEGDSSLFRAAAS